MLQSINNRVSVDTIGLRWEVAAFGTCRSDSFLYSLLVGYKLDNC